MYWQKRFNRENPDKQLEDEITKIHIENKDYGYRRVYRRTFHSDRGWAYQMGAYSSVLKENKIFQSMSRKGNCYDNSVMENFFGILKQEMYYGTTYYSFDELKEAIERYIKYYNEKRIKEKLGWMSPVQYRLNTLAA